jgi:hypothetical protein
MTQPAKAHENVFPFGTWADQRERRFVACVHDAGGEGEIARINIVGDCWVAGANVLRRNDESLWRPGAHAGKRQQWPNAGALDGATAMTNRLRGHHDTLSDGKSRQMNGPLIRAHRAWPCFVVDALEFRKPWPVMLKTSPPLKA